MTSCPLQTSAMGSPYRTNVDLAKELLAEGHPLVCELDGHLIDLKPRWHRFIMLPYLHPDVVARFLPLMKSIAAVRHLGGCAEAYNSCVDPDEDADYADCECECGTSDCEYCDYNEAHDEAHVVLKWRSPASPLLQNASMRKLKESMKRPRTPSSSPFSVSKNQLNVMAARCEHLPN